jgi:hypothetical protein
LGGVEGVLTRRMMRMQRSLMAWSFVQPSIRRTDHCNSILRIALPI